MEVDLHQICCPPDAHQPIPLPASHQSAGSAGSDGPNDPGCEGSFALGSVGFGGCGAAAHASDTMVLPIWWNVPGERPEPISDSSDVWAPLLWAREEGESRVLFKYVTYTEHTPMKPSEMHGIQSQVCMGSSRGWDVGRAGAWDGEGVCRRGLGGAEGGAALHSV